MEAIKTFPNRHDPAKETAENCATNKPTNPETGKSDGTDVFQRFFLEMDLCKSLRL